MNKLTKLLLTGALALSTFYGCERSEPKMQNISGNESFLYSNDQDNQRKYQINDCNPERPGFHVDIVNVMAIDGMYPHLSFIREGIDTNKCGVNISPDYKVPLTDEFARKILKLVELNREREYEVKKAKWDVDHEGIKNE